MILRPQIIITIVLANLERIAAAFRHQQTARFLCWYHQKGFKEARKGQQPKACDDATFL